jgi:hypothetical protein
MRQEEPASEATDLDFQGKLLGRLQDLTGVTLAQA